MPSGGDAQDDAGRLEQDDHGTALRQRHLLHAVVGHDRTDRITAAQCDDHLAVHRAGRQPADRAAQAVAPAGPDPTTIKSYLSIIFHLFLDSVELFYKC